MDPAGYLELGWPQWDRFAIAHYSLVIDPQHPNEPDETANQEYVELTFKADAGNVYLVIFLSSSISVLHPRKTGFPADRIWSVPSNQQPLRVAIISRGLLHQSSATILRGCASSLT